MALSRRNFLKLVGGSTAGAAILSACRPQVQDFLIQSPLQMPEDQVTGIDTWYATRCAECGAGCGTIVRVVEGRAKKVEGNPEHPINAGKLCVRGHGAVQELYHPDRIRRPMIATGGRGSGRFEEITWDRAMDELAARLGQARGAGAAAGLVLATEPMEGHLALVLARFAGAFGNAVHAQYDPMDRSVEAAAIQRVFGTPSMPDFDIAHTNRILNFGADFLTGWVSQVRFSRGYGDFRHGEGRSRGTLVHIGSRFSGTAANADEWVPVKPGSEGKLALAIAHVIVRDGKAHPTAAGLFGANAATALAAFAPAAVAAATGVPAEKIEAIAKDFAEHQPGIAIGGGSAGAQSNGLFNLTAIYALNRLVGNVGQPGGVRLNPPSPLAADPLFANIPVGRYAATPFAEWQRIIERMRGGQVNALLVKNANLVHGLPASVNVLDALSKVPFVASFSSFLDDTTYYADLVLPTSLPLEDWGASTPNPGPGYPSITFQQPVVRPFQETRGFADIMLALGQEMGMESVLPWASYRDLLRESAQKLFQSGQAGGAPAPSFEAFWNETLRKGGWWNEQAPAVAAPAAPPAIDVAVQEPVFQGTEQDYPYTLVPFEAAGIGAGRGAHLPWMQSVPDPVTTVAWDTWVEMNSKAAAEKGWKEGDILLVETGAEAMELMLYPNPALPRGVLAVPVGGGHIAYGRYADKFGVNVLHRLAPKTEAATGALAWGANRARVSATGRRGRLSKLEGTVVPTDVGGNIRVIKG
jgi:anaerobic selenocysteine-containing dehydrogenase